MSVFIRTKGFFGGLLDYDISRRQILVLKAYFDDSGTHDSSKAVVWAGFMATEDQWTAFEDKWTALLKREGLKTFHMTEVHNCLGQCLDWSRARSDSVIHDFRQVIAEMDVVGIGSVVRTDDWAEVVAPHPWLVERLVSPIHLAWEHTVQQALHWAQRRAEAGMPPEKVAMIFDLKQSEAARCIDVEGMYRKDQPWFDWFNGAAFFAMQDHLPLQAADMLAWETYTLEKERHSQGGEPDLRPHFKAMIRDVPLHGQFYDSEALRTLVSQIATRERPDLMRPQGSVPEKGWLTMAQKHKLLRGIDDLDGKGVDYVERTVAGLPENERQEARVLIEDYIEQLRNAPKPTDDG
jgi:hypothetical protein